MIKEIELKLAPNDAYNEPLIKSLCAKKLHISEENITEIIKLKRSVDARKEPKIILKLAIYINESFKPEIEIKSNYKSVNPDKKILIVGAGPAGYFAALELIELGIKPIIFERGKDVQSRRVDLRQIQQFGVVNSHSNYCFGEGGAGTYSDGKLYTRATKRGDIKKILKILVEHGAKTDILIDSHPHIGSNVLPVVVKNIRETILNFGGEIHFNSHVTDFIIKDDNILGLVVNDSQEHFGDSVILATGHSSRDIFYLLNNKKIEIESKPFAIGVRIEHSQNLIDSIQYRQTIREEHLPASSYQLISQANGRGVFSFCMCPGGFIVPSATAPGEIVVNGMSLSKRDSKYANSGIVVAVENEDLQDYHQYGALAGLELQKYIEQKVFIAGGGSTQQAPAQRMTDF
ncbi:MAG: FAD-dependent monooxygenase, partial [Candidatus Sericytochromatia bacterium]|nr:FAD-dependent monooxygenase [Candidatus Sericytochromatia bacterium]